MRLIMSFVFSLMACVVMGQSTVYLRADSVRIRKEGGNSNLIIENSTRDSTNGVLLNYGLGRTRFQRIRAINDTQFTVGGDTITLSGSGASAVRLNELLEADGTNDINNANYSQDWRWNSLSGDGTYGLKLSSNSTATGSFNSVLDISRSGANSNSGAFRSGLNIVVNNTGTNSTNYAALYSASGATNSIGTSSTASGSSTYGIGLLGNTLTTGDSAKAVMGWAQGGAATNYGGWFSANSGTTNYALFTNSGSVRFRYLESAGAGFVKADAMGLLYKSDTASGGGPIPINDLLAADGTNDIDNTDYNQTWKWNSLTGDALTLQSTSTAGANNNKVLEIIRSGANASSSITSYGLHSTISNTGTSSTNYGGYFDASGATNNYGIRALGTSFGGYLSTSGTSPSGKWGVYGYSTGASSENHGVQGAADGATTNYGVRGSASGGTTSYGGYFNASAATTNYGLYVENGISRFQHSTNYTITTKTADYTADATNHTILVDATSGNVTISLPTVSASSMPGRVYTIKRIDNTGNTVTIDANGSQTIDGNLTYSLTAQYKYVTIQTDALAWYVIANN